MRLSIWGSAILILMAVIGLNVAGFVVDVFYVRDHFGAGGDTAYFQYHLAPLGQFPYWLFALFSLFFFNGIAICRLAFVGGGVEWGFSGIRFWLNLQMAKLFGFNLVFVSALIGLFVVLLNLRSH